MIFPRSNHAIFVAVNSVLRSPKVVRAIEVMGLNRLKIGFTSSELTIRHSDSTKSLFRAHSAIEIGAKVCHHGLNMTG